MLKFCLPLCLLTTLAAAETPMSGAAFDAYVTGKTLTFSENGQPYGIERYLPGRRVQWSFLDGKCKDGLWYPLGEQICFVYEDDFEPQCWAFYQEGNGLRAVFDGGAETELYEADEGAEMICEGPDVGV